MLKTTCKKLEKASKNKGFEPGVDKNLHICYDMKTLTSVNKFVTFV